MDSLILLLLTGLIEYSIDALLVGLAFAFYLTKRGVEISAYSALPVLFAIFAFLELYFIPSFLSLDATFTINNPSLAEFLETKPNTSLSEYLAPDLLSSAIWFIQASVAFGIGNWLGTKKQITTGSSGLPVK